MPTLLLATGNPGKAREVQALFQTLTGLAGWEVKRPGELGLTLPDVDETGATFAENAALKATALARSAGLPALADDSGLCVDALGGEPGIRSARWTGPGQSDAQRTAALLARLDGVPAGQRTARFVCALCAALPDGRSAAAEGVCPGWITRAAVGSGGFGYDPIFGIAPDGPTLAELPAETKNAISHRRHALIALAGPLRELLEKSFP